MARVWRLLLTLCVLAMIGPALAALAIIAWGKLAGCAPDAECGNLGAALAFTLDWAWQRVLNPLMLSALAAGAAVGAAYGWEGRGNAMVWSLFGTCWGPIAALILPYIAVFWSIPRGCRIAEGGSPDCVLWGHAMGAAYDSVTIAFWLSVIIIPIGIGGLIATFVLATLRRRGAEPGGNSD